MSICASFIFQTNPNETHFDAKILEAVGDEHYDGSVFGEYHGYADSETKTYTVEFTMKQSCDNAKVAFDLGYCPAVYFVKDISLVCIE